MTRNELHRCKAVLIFYEGVIGLAKGNAHMIDVSFDILSVEALFLLPRLFSLLSLIPFFGTLVGGYFCIEVLKGCALTMPNRYPV